MSYERVIPRDLFNEASLLKCYGHLYICTEGNPRAHFEDDFVGSFDVLQRPDDGSLYIENLVFVIGEEKYRLTRTLNSRAPWPLYAEKINDDDFDPIPVFDSQGELSADIQCLISFQKVTA